MKTDFTISLSRIVKEFSLEILNMPTDPESIMISTAEINRPGLQFAGYYEYFDPNRIQILGMSEIGFLNRFTEEKLNERVGEFFAKKPTAVVIARGLSENDVYKKMQGAVNMETGKMAFSGTSGSVSQILSSNATFDGNFVVKAEVQEGTLFEAQQRITKEKRLQTGFGG